jgi:hypothetical protein
MVIRSEQRGVPAVRLVQDFGHSDEAADLPATPPLRLPLTGSVAEPPQRKRGRPAGSRSRRTPASNGHDTEPPLNR